MHYGGKERDSEDCHWRGGGYQRFSFHCDYIGDACVYIDHKFSVFFPKYYYGS